MSIYRKNHNSSELTKEDVFSADLGVLLCQPKKICERILLVEELVNSLFNVLQLASWVGTSGLRHLR